MLILHTAQFSFHRGAPEVAASTARTVVPEGDDVGEVGVDMSKDSIETHASSMWKAKAAINKHKNKVCFD